MEKVRIALVLITVAITVGPILGVVLYYRNNPLDMIIPPELSNGFGGFGGNSQNATQPGQNGSQTSDINDLIDSFLSGDGTIPSGINDIITPPGPEDIHYDPVTRTFTASFKINNTFPYDMTINSINGTVECDEHNFPIGPITLKNPVNVKAGASATATITGQWSEEAIKHLEKEHPGEQSIKCSLVGAVFSFTSFGISGTYPSPEPISLGEIPLTGS